ncbi:deoxyribose-phosphate aldolase [Rothia sp. LK2588]|uniref:deoxyribose-phosphate aldolase n=1 Tax=Rothia sp. LK2588 TaxID=3114369 RepID=UPI0034CE83FB
MTNTAQLIDHTLLAPDATAAQVEKLCAEAREHEFFSVCVSPNRVALAAETLSGSAVKVCTVVGFPSGVHTTTTKAFETENAVANGADEIDMVINIGAAKDADWQLVEDDIRGVVQASDEALVKVILETCLLTDDEIVAACRAAQNAGADFVKTSTGFSTGGATTHAVRLMRETVGPDMGVKASGGVRTAQALHEMVDAGANRIGASAGAALLGEEN